jgi:hypothetical protein
MGIDVNSDSFTHQLRHSDINDTQLNFVKQELVKPIEQNILDSLLEFHLAEYSNLKVAELLLRRGANPNHITGSSCSYSFGLREQQRHEIYTFDKDYFRFQPLAFAITYADGYLCNEHQNAFKKLPQKLSLLCKYGLDVNLPNFHEKSLLNAVSRLAPLAGRGNEDEYYKTVAKSVAVLLINKAKIDTDTFKEIRNEKLFSNVLRNIGGIQLLKKFHRSDRTLEEYSNIIQSHLDSVQENKILIK